WPLVGALEHPVVGGIGFFGDGFALGADVDLFAPVGLTQGQLAPYAGVAAKVRALHVLDAQLVVEWQGEEVAGRGNRVIEKLLWNAVPSQVEEPVLVGGFPQFGAERCGFIRSPVEAGK